MHSKRTDTIIAFVGGFFVSFTSFLLMPYLKLGKGQLIAGDPSANRELPTTLNALKDVADGSGPIMSQLTSYGWWVAVLIGAAIAAFILLKLLRRYV